MGLALLYILYSMSTIINFVNQPKYYYNYDSKLILYALQPDSDTLLCCSELC